MGLCVRRRRIVFRRWSIWLLTLYDGPRNVKGLVRESSWGGHHDDQASEPFPNVDWRIEMSAERKRWVIGEVHTQPLYVTVEREPEVGIAWQACCDQLHLCALGATPSEAASNLSAALHEHGVSDGVRHWDRKLLAALEDEPDA